MSQMKTRLQALTQLDRALAAITDAELGDAVDRLDDDHRSALDVLCEAPSGGFTDPAARVLSMRAAAARGRLNGDLERVATVVSDECLARCIELLGDDADNPSEDEFLAVVPPLVEQFGVPVVRLMMAAVVAGEAPASVMLTRLLKSHESLALPAAAPAPALEVLPPRRADDDVKARRKAAKERKQAEARARREQQLRARSR
ncbi:MAG: hypothetical protein ACKO27_12800 [Ilumatobacteraceae bacterium]